MIGVIRVTGEAIFSLPLARIWLYFGAFSLQATVAVTDIGPEEAFLGMDVGVHKYLEALAETQVAQTTAWC